MSTNQTDPLDEILLKCRVTQGGFLHGRLTEEQCEAEFSQHKAAINAEIAKAVREARIEELEHLRGSAAIDDHYARMPDFLEARLDELKEDGK